LYATQGGSQYIPLSGTLHHDSSFPGGRFFLVQRDAHAPVHPPENPSIDFSDIVYITPFAQLSDAGVQLSLGQVTNAGTTTLDATPVVGRCRGWCAGSAPTPIGKGFDSEGSFATLSMERVDARLPGVVASNWESNDTYTASANMPGGGGRTLYATVLAENSLHRTEDVGWYCAPDQTPILAGQHYKPQSGTCTYLARFIAWPRIFAGGIFKGTVGSSTMVTHVTTRRFANMLEVTAPLLVAEPGEPFFVALWEDSHPFIPYFTESVVTGALPPHTNYHIIPFVFGP
jgi:hypothetical protein